jgi:hypothetical protein
MDDRKHIVTARGVAVCGVPARLGNLVTWGEHTCDICAALYAAAVRRARR